MYVLVCIVCGVFVYKHIATFQVNVCIETLCKYIENIVANPTEEKFRKIRQSNKAYQERIFPIEGTKEFLEAAGFEQQELPFSDTTDKFWVRTTVLKFTFDLCYELVDILLEMISVV